MATLGWLPPRGGVKAAASAKEAENAHIVHAPFVQTPADAVRVFILQLAQQRWGTLARLVQLTCISCRSSAQVCVALAQAGCAGILIDVLVQAPRHHVAWAPLSVAATQLLCSLLHADDMAAMEISQPMALRLLLAMLKDNRTHPRARQHVAAILHLLVSGRATYRDKLAAAGALPILLRLLRDLPSLVDLALVQDVLWSIIALTDPGASSTPGASTCLELPVAAALVPLLQLYTLLLPGATHLDHLAALIVRALHSQVAGHDVGKELLRRSGALACITSLVTRHGAAYSADTARAVWEAQGQGRMIPGSGSGGRAAAAAAHQGPAAGLVFGTSRPEEHEGGCCEGHTGAAAAAAAVAAVPLTATPATRLLAVLLLQGLIADGSSGGGGAARRGRQGKGEGDAAAGAGAGDASLDDGQNTPSPIESDGEEEEAPAATSAAPHPQQQQGGEILPAADAAHNHNPFSASTASPSDRRAPAQRPPPSPGAAADAAAQDAMAHWLSVAAPPPLDPRSDALVLCCYGLLLPLLTDESIASGAAASGSSGSADGSASGTASGNTSGGGGGGGVSGGVASLPAAPPHLGATRRLCPLRESLATLKTLMCDCAANQEAVVAAGVVQPLVDMVARGDMGLAWQCAEACVYLSEGGHGGRLIGAGAVEELALLLQEAAAALHGLTLRKQIHEGTTALAAASAAGHGHAGGGGHGGHGTHGGHGGHGHTHGGGGGGVGAGNRHAGSGGGGGGGGGGIGAGGSLGVSGMSDASSLLSLLAQVHVVPSPVSQRPQRIYLVGRLPLDFTTSSCLYHTHATPLFCDYCTPSAAMKALLRLTSASAPTSASVPPPTDGDATSSSSAPYDPSSPYDDAPDAFSAFTGLGDAVGGGGSSSGIGSVGGSYGCREVSRRFVAAGGLHGLLLLLHHEAAGVHHSKLASSLISLLDVVLLCEPRAQDEIRSIGGVGVVLSLLASMLRPGVMDVYQLRSATCRTLALLLQGSPANKSVVRELRGLHLLTALLAAAAGPRTGGATPNNTHHHHPSSSAGPGASGSGSGGSGSGGSGATSAAAASTTLPSAAHAHAHAMMAELVLDDSTQLLTAALRAVTAAAEGCPPNQEALVGHGALALACDLARSQVNDDELRLAALYAAAALVDGYSVGQAGVVSAGLVPVAVAWAQKAGGVGPPAAAAGTLLWRLAGAPSARTALALSGGMQALLAMLRPHPPGLATHAALCALTALAQGNTELQNDAVSAGVLPLLNELLKEAYLTTGRPPAGAQQHQQQQRQQRGAVAVPMMRQGRPAPHLLPALSLLAALLASNTYSKNTARSAGLPARLVQLMRSAFMGGALPIAAAAARALSELSASNHANQELVGEEGGLEVAVELARVCMDEACVLRLPCAAAAGGGDGDGDDAAAAADASAAAMQRVQQHAALLAALWRLVCSLAEFNPSNKDALRELGGVTLLCEFLLSASSLLLHGSSSSPSASPSAGSIASGANGVGGAAAAAGGSSDGVLASNGLLPAVGTACRTVRALCAEGDSELTGALTEDGRLGRALMVLTEVEDPAVACDVARALEWVSVRSSIMVPLVLNGPDHQQQHHDNNNDALSGGAASSGIPGMLPGILPGVSSSTSSRSHEPELDMLQTLVRLLYSTGGGAPSGSGAGGGASSGASDAHAAYGTASAAAQTMTPPGRSSASGASSGSFTSASGQGQGHAQAAAGGGGGWGGRPLGRASSATSGRLTAAAGAMGTAFGAAAGRAAAAVAAGGPSGPAASTHAAAASGGGGGGGHRVTAASVKEAANVVQQVVAAAESAVQQQWGASATPSGPSPPGSTTSSFSFSRGVSALFGRATPAPAAAAPAAAPSVPSSSLPPLPPAAASRTPSATAPAGAAGHSAPTSPPPPVHLPNMPPLSEDPANPSSLESVVLDPTSPGLMVNAALLAGLVGAGSGGLGMGVGGVGVGGRSGSITAAGGIGGLLSGGSTHAAAAVQQLIGKAAANFQRVTASGGLSGDGPQREFKTQLAWLLFLLALKSGANRQLLLRVVKTGLEPLATQLLHAELCREQLEAVSTASAAAAAAAAAASAAAAAASGTAGAAGGAPAAPAPSDAAAAAAALPQPDVSAATAKSFDAAFREQQLQAQAQYSSSQGQATHPSQGQGGQGGQGVLTQPFGSGIVAHSSLAGALPVSMPADEMDVQAMRVPPEQCLAPSPDRTTPTHSHALPSLTHQPAAAHPQQQQQQQRAAATPPLSGRSSHGGGASSSSSSGGGGAHASPPAAAVAAAGAAGSLQQPAPSADSPSGADRGATRSSHDHATSYGSLQAQQQQQQQQQASDVAAAPYPSSAPSSAAPYNDPTMSASAAAAAAAISALQLRLHAHDGLDGSGAYENSYEDVDVGRALPMLGGAGSDDDSDPWATDSPTAAAALARGRGSEPSLLPQSQSQSQQQQQQQQQPAEPNPFLLANDNGDASGDAGAAPGQAEGLGLGLDVSCGSEGSYGAEGEEEGRREHELLAAGDAAAAAMASAAAAAAATSHSEHHPERSAHSASAAPGPALQLHSSSQHAPTGGTPHRPTSLPHSNLSLTIHARDLPTTPPSGGGAPPASHDEPAAAPAAGAGSAAGAGAGAAGAGGGGGGGAGGTPPGGASPLSPADSFTSPGGGRMDSGLSDSMMSDDDLAMIAQEVELLTSSTMYSVAMDAARAAQAAISGSSPLQAVRRNTSSAQNSPMR